MHITLKHEAKCADCGATLPAGSKARYYRDGSVFGNDCHRWRIDLSPRQTEALRRALAGLLAAYRRQQVPVEVSARLKALKGSFGQAATRENYRALLAEVRALTASFRRPREARSRRPAPSRQARPALA